MKFNISKEKFTLKVPKFIPKSIPNLMPKTTPAAKSEFEQIVQSDQTELKLASLPNTITEESEEIPNFISVNRLDFDDVEIHGGIIKDSSSKGGLKYSVIQPRLSVRDKKNFDIITKLLMTELSVSMHEIKSKKEAERRLKRKILQLIKKYKNDLGKLAEREKDLEIQRNTLANVVEQKTNELLKAERMANISHVSSRLANGLRNPINIIKNGTDLLKQSKNIAKKDLEWLLKIEKATNRVSFQIDEVLKVSSKK